MAEVHGVSHTGTYDRDKSASLDTFFFLPKKKLTFTSFFVLIMSTVGNRNRSSENSSETGVKGNFIPRRTREIKYLDRPSEFRKFIWKRGKR